MPRRISAEILGGVDVEGEAGQVEDDVVDAEARRARRRSAARRSGSGRGPGGRIETAFVPPSSARAIAIPRSGVAASELLDVLGGSQQRKVGRDHGCERRGDDLAHRRGERVVPGAARRRRQTSYAVRDGSSRDDRHPARRPPPGPRRRRARAARASAPRARSRSSTSARRLFASSSRFSGTSTWASIAVSLPSATYAHRVLDRPLEELLSEASRPARAGRAGSSPTRRRSSSR